MLDIGAPVHHLSSFGVDLEVNPVRGIFDLAVNFGALPSYKDLQEPI